MSPRRYLLGPFARRVEDLLGLRPYSLLAVERRRTGWSQRGLGDYGLVFATQEFGGRFRFVRTLRLTETRVERRRPRTFATYLARHYGLTLTRAEAHELQVLVAALALADQLRRQALNGREAA